MDDLDLALPWWWGCCATAIPGLAITIDPVEHRGFEYQTGISFIYFARGVQGRIGPGRALSETLAGDGLW